MWSLKEKKKSEQRSQRKEMRLVVYLRQGVGGGPGQKEHTCTDNISKDRECLVHPDDCGPHCSAVYLKVVQSRA